MDPLTYLDAKLRAHNKNMPYKKTGRAKFVDSNYQEKIRKLKG